MTAAIQFLRGVMLADLRAWVVDELRTVPGGARADHVAVLYDAIANDPHHPPFGALGELWDEYLRHVDVVATVEDLELRHREVACECMDVAAKGVHQPMAVRVCRWRGAWIETRLVRYAPLLAVAKVHNHVHDAQSSAHAPPLLVGLFGRYARVSALCLPRVQRSWTDDGLELDRDNPYVQVIA